MSGHAPRLRRRSADAPNSDAPSRTVGRRYSFGDRTDDKLKRFQFLQRINRKRRRVPQTPSDPTLSVQSQANPQPLISRNPPKASGDHNYSVGPSTSANDSPGGSGDHSYASSSKKRVVLYSSIPQQEAGVALREARDVLGDQFQPEDHMSLERLPVKRSPLGPFFEAGFRLRLRNLPSNTNAQRLWLLLNAVLSRSCLEMLEGARPNVESGQIVASHDALYSCKSTPWELLDSLSIQGLMKQLQAANQSDSKVDLQGLTFTLRRAYTGADVGQYGARSRNLAKRYGDGRQWAKFAKCTVDPTNILKLEGEDLLNCLPAACLIGVFLDGKDIDGKNCKLIIKNRGFIRQRIKPLIETAFHGAREGGMFQLQHAENFAQALMPPHQIHCFTNQGAPIVKYGPQNASIIRLFFHDSHVWVITDIGKFISGKSNTRKWLCVDCYELEAKDKKHRHRCNRAGCQSCKHTDCPNRDGRVYLKGIRCPLCSLMLHTEDCLTFHRSLDCEPAPPCPRCGSRNIDKKHAETCGTFFCGTCRRRRPYNHRCFMAKLALQTEKAGEKGKVGMKRFYLDFETQTRAESGEHRPNLLIAQCASLQGEGKDGSEEAEPEVSLFEPIVYRGRSCVQDFVKDLLEEGGPFKDSYCIFHNLAGYDGHFIFAELIRRKVDCKPLFREQRLMTMHLETQNIKFRDSLLFIPNTPLASLPKMWGLREGDEKGRFPHGLNTEEILYAPNATGIFNEGHGTHWPPKKYFMPNNMKKEERASFTTWWRSENSRYQKDLSLRYDVMKELESYCMQDVRILRLSFEAFLRTCWRRNPGVSVLESITLPSYCNTVFRSLHLQEGSIALIPELGFRQTTSREALIWLAWEKSSRGLRTMQTARHGPEVRIFGRGVDVYGEDIHGRKYVFEYLGCYWHSHECKNTAASDWENLRRATNREQNQDRLDTLKRLSTEIGGVHEPFELIVAWECEVEAARRVNVEMQTFFARYLEGFSDEPLNPRKAMAGGRTQPVMHLLDSARDPEEAASYLDFTSLYPAVNACTDAREQYPVGLPTVLLSIESKERWGNVEEALKAGAAFGLIHCTLNPPKKCLYPSIYMHLESKLVFPLCRSCMEKRCQSDCQHTDEERAITGVYTTYEVQFALTEQGYSLRSCFEIWHFERRSSTLLRSFIYDCYLDKEYASGPPSWATTSELLEKHASDVHALLGVDVDPAKFIKNPSMRSLAKVMINSFWGFFGKKSDQTTHSIILDFASFRQLDGDPKKLIQNASLIEDIILVAWKPKDPKPDSKSSIILAAFTTAMARVRLNRAMMDHTGKVAYVDTDSILLVGKAPASATGAFGELKDELEADYPGQNAFIAAYSCLGSKTYILIICDGSGRLLEIRKRMKGIIINYLADQVMDRDRFVRIVEQARSSAREDPIDDDTELGVTRVRQTVFKKNYRKLSVRTMDILKRVQFTSNKQRILLDTPNLDSIPFGFKSDC